MRKGLLVLVVSAQLVAALDASARDVSDRPLNLSCITEPPTVDEPWKRDCGPDPLPTLLVLPEPEPTPPSSTPPIFFQHEGGRKGEGGGGSDHGRGGGSDRPGGVN